MYRYWSSVWVTLFECPKGVKGYGHADADADAMSIQNMRRIYCAISDICRIMRISASMRIGKCNRMANPNVKHARRAQSPRLLVVLMISMMMISWRANYHGVGEMSP